MAKILSLIGLILSCLIVLLFGIDLVARFPFRGASIMMDIVFVVSGLMLAYMSWATMREQV